MDFLNLGGGVDIDRHTYISPDGVMVTSSIDKYSDDPEIYNISHLFNGVVDSGNTADYWMGVQDSANQTLTFDFTAIGFGIANIQDIIVYPRTRSDTRSDYRIFARTKDNDWIQVIDWVGVTSETPMGTSFTHTINMDMVEEIYFEFTRSGTWGVSCHEIQIQGSFYQMKHLIKSSTDNSLMCILNDTLLELNNSPSDESFNQYGISDITLLNNEYSKKSFIMDLDRIEGEGKIYKKMVNINDINNMEVK